MAILKCAVLAVMLSVVLGVPVDLHNAVQNTCAGKPADIFFILDASTSIWNPDFKTQLRFVENIVQMFDIGADRTRVGVITFGNTPVVQFDLDTITRKSYMLDKISRIWQSGGGTYTAEALDKMTELMVAKARKNVTKVAIIITDGDSHIPEQTARAAVAARATGMHLFAIGVGPNVKTKELNDIASDPDDQYVFAAANFDALDEIKDLLAIRTCEAEEIPQHDESSESDENDNNDRGDTPPDDYKHKSSKRPTPVTGTTVMTPPAKGCGGKPADIVIVADASSSIWGVDFNKQKKFIKTLINAFEVSPSMTRFGVVTFSDESLQRFHLKDYRTSEAIIKAVGKIDQTLGGTNTASALRTTIDAFKRENGGRPGLVAQIAIVLTDGRSMNPEDTKVAAKMLKDHNVHVFAIGIGEYVDELELTAIASEPASTYRWMVDNYDTLVLIQNMLAVEACKAEVITTTTTTAATTTTTTTTTTPPPPPPTTTTTPPPPQDQGCGAHTGADVMFAMPGGGLNPRHISKGLTFMKGLVKDFEIGENKVRVGLVPRECDSVAGFDLNQYHTKDAILAALNGGTNPFYSRAAAMIRHMRTQSFRRSNGARANVQKFSIFVVDGSTSCDEVDIIAGEMQKFRLHHRGEVYAIGVGKDVCAGVLSTLASSRRHILRATNYNDLQNLRSTISDRICTGLL